MAWTKPEYSKRQVDEAGRLATQLFVPAPERDCALAIVGNWRASHAFPLNTLQMGLRKHATRVYQHALIAQRLKRLSSIEYKLERFPTMSLSRMQDIGGCRAVVRTPREAERVRDSYVGSRVKHELVNEKDYILHPKESGYRSIHLIYRYQSDRSTAYNGLLIEMQIRSRLQHAWATAVETAGIFLEHSLKSSVGPGTWLRYFALAGSVFAIREKCPTVPGTPDDPFELASETTDLLHSLNVIGQLERFGRAISVTLDADLPRGHFYLLVLSANELRITSYQRKDLAKATRRYLIEEQKAEVLKGSHVVLVSAESVMALKKAYPNYYGDTQVFLSEIVRALREIIG